MPLQAAPRTRLTKWSSGPGMRAPRILNGPAQAIEPEGFEEGTTPDIGPASAKTTPCAFDEQGAQSLRHVAVHLDKLRRRVPGRSCIRAGRSISAVSPRARTSAETRRTLISNPPAHRQSRKPGAVLRLRPARRKIAGHFSSSPSVFGLPVVPLLAALCRCLVLRKRKKKGNVTET